MVTQFGMSDALGPMALGQNHDQVFLGRDFANTPDYSDTVAFEIDKEVRRMLEESYTEAREICVQHRDVLDSIVQALLDKETIEKEELAAILAPVAKRPPRMVQGNGRVKPAGRGAPARRASTPPKND